MTNKELSAWASALIKLIQHGFTDDAIEILESVVIKNDRKSQEKDNQTMQNNK